MKQSEQLNFTGAAAVQANRIFQLHRQSERRRKAVSILAAVVFAVSVYSMVLPAVTMDRDSFFTQQESTQPAYSSDGEAVTCQNERHENESGEAEKGQHSPVVPEPEAAAMTGQRIPDLSCHETTTDSTQASPVASETKIVAETEQKNPEPHYSETVREDVPETTAANESAQLAANSGAEGIDSGVSVRTDGAASSHIPENVENLSGSKGHKDESSRLDRWELDTGTVFSGDEISLKIGFNVGEKKNRVKEGDYILITWPGTGTARLDCQPVPAEVLWKKAVIATTALEPGRLTITFTKAAETAAGVKPWAILNLKFTAVAEPAYPEHSAELSISGSTYSSTVTVEKKNDFYKIFDASAGNYRRVLDPQGNIASPWSLCLNHNKPSPGSSSEATGEYIKTVNPTEEQYMEFSGNNIPGSYLRVKRILYAKAVLYPEYNYYVFQDELYFAVTGMAKYDTTWQSPELNAQKLRIRAAADSKAFDADIESRLEVVIYRERGGRYQNTITAQIKNLPPPDTAAFTVRKLVDGEWGEQDRDFHFTLCLYGKRSPGTTAVPPLSGAYEAVKNGVSETVIFDASGKIEFTLKHNESFTITGIEKGFYYKIAELEADTDGYITAVDRPLPTGQYDPGGDFNNFDTSDGVADEITVTFTNNRQTLPSSPDKVSIPVVKVWDGTPADSVTVRLFADGEAVSAVQLNELNGWRHVFENLDKYNSGGMRILYTLTEDEVPGYESVISGGCDYGACGFTVTNVELPPTVRLKLKKLVTGAGDKNRDFHFTVNLVNGGGEPLTGDYPALRDGEWEAIAFNSAGTAKLILRHGESITITDLPGGFYYIVSEDEADRDGYETTVDRPNSDEQDDETGGVNNWGADSGVEEGTVSITFTNHKDGPVGYHAQVNAHKTLGGEKPQNGQFAFILSDSSEHEIGRQRNDGNGDIVFRFDLPGPGTYEYTLRELNDGLSGITYDEHIYTVHITAKASPVPGGEPEITVSYDNAPEPAEFQNQYSYLLPETGGSGKDGYIGGGAVIIFSAMLSLCIIKLVHRKEDRFPCAGG